MKGKEVKKEKRKEKAETGKVKNQSDYQKEKDRKTESVMNLNVKK